MAGKEKENMENKKRETAACLSDRIQRVERQAAAAAAARG